MRGQDTAPRGELAAHFDAFHTTRAATPLVSAMYAEAMRDAYPHEVAPYSSCDWPLLGVLVGRLQLRPGGLLADVGCGTGGVGLWLARACSVRLVGVDVSPAAVLIASGRAAELGDRLPADADFHVGSLEVTGLADGVVDGLVVVDAFANADAGRALAEVRRVLAPGGRAVMTRAGGPGVLERVRQQVGAAGLEVVGVDARPDEPAMWGRLYRLWREREEELRQAVGDVQTDNMLREAERMLPRLASRTALAVTVSRPAG
ncbi:class I SAM-dependent methyltransferase [Streptomyces anandii]|uniref:class I SAM-dependent methyltransferase n=1 Tax=Streptomyces anandii TaxID=285454 RepID=UPI0037AA4FCD